MKVQDTMTVLGDALATHGWMLRSGGADGADIAFETGADRHEEADWGEPSTVKEVYLPWRGFNHSKSPLHELPERAFEIAYEHHPKPDWLRRQKHVNRLMARNTLQVLGYDLRTPVKMIICWTPDGVEHGDQTTKYTGGTGQAIRIASAYSIPVFNLKNEYILDRIVDFVESLDG